MRHDLIKHISDELALEKEMQNMADVLSFEYYDYKLKQLANKIKFQNGQNIKLKSSNY